MSAPTRYWKGLRVPYIVPWSQERALPGRIVVRSGIGGTGIGYADEESRVDRRDDVLWVRNAHTPGFGVPELPGMHPLRQRTAVDRMLCQVCGTSAINSSSGDERYLFLLAAKDGRPIQEGERTVSPPIHLDCARESVRDCPHLKRHTAAFVEYCPGWGVAGIEYDPRTVRPLPADGLVFVPYEDSDRLRWTLAARSVISLHGITTVSLSELALTA
ncbi:hypothetical protein [Streptomyces virginiae]|uniref:hypothetical protein n=1 Tax=Streptomyces virginiae TaxID=1961 RepID=UPI003646C64E